MNSIALDGIELCPFRLIGHGLRERIGFGHADRFILIEHKDTVRLECCQFSDRLCVAGSDFRWCGHSGFLSRSRRLAGSSGLSRLRLDVCEAEVCSEVCSGAAGGPFTIIMTAMRSPAALLRSAERRFSSGLSCFSASAFLPKTSAKARKFPRKLFQPSALLGIRQTVGAIGLKASILREMRPEMKMRSGLAELTVSISTLLTLLTSLQSVESAESQGRLRV